MARGLRSAPLAGRAEPDSQSNPFEITLDASVASRAATFRCARTKIGARYSFHYFVQRETSREDGNDVELWNNDLIVGLVYRF